MAWSEWIDLEYDDDDMLNVQMPLGGDRPSYPPEMRCAFVDLTLDKAGMDMPKKGDLIHLIVFGEVTSIRDDEFGRRAEVQFQKFKWEDEDAESAAEGADG